MAVKEWMICIGFIIVVVVFLIEICYVLLIIRNAVIYKKQSKRMWHGVEELLATYYTLRDYEMFVFEIDNLYKYIIASNQDLSKQYANISELLDKYLLAINTKDIETNSDNISDYKKLIYELKKEYDERNPLEQIKGTDYLVLKQLLDTIEKGDSKECRSIVNKISIELKGLRDRLMENEKNERKQEHIAKLGIVLSIVFGIMTIVQFFV